MNSPSKSIRLKFILYFPFHQYAKKRPVLKERAFERRNLTNELKFKICAKRPKCGGYLDKPGGDYHVELLPLSPCTWSVLSHLSLET